MSKRVASGSGPATRKRKKGDISSSTAVLDLVSTLSSKPQVMQVWHSNTLDPTTSRQLSVPIMSMPIAEEVSTGSLEEAVDTGVSLVHETVVPPVRKTRVKQKRNCGNDSVGHSLLILIRRSSDSFNRSK